MRANSAKNKLQTKRVMVQKVQEAMSNRQQLSKKQIQIGDASIVERKATLAANMKEREHQHEIIEEEKAKTDQLLEVLPSILTDEDFQDDLNASIQLELFSSLLLDDDGSAPPAGVDVAKLLGVPEQGRNDLLSPLAGRDLQASFQDQGVVNINNSKGLVASATAAASSNRRVLFHDESTRSIVDTQGSNVHDDTHPTVEEKSSQPPTVKPTAAGAKKNTTVSYCSVCCVCFVSITLVFFLT